MLLSACIVWFQKQVSNFFNIPKSGTKLDIILAESSKKTRNAHMLIYVSMLYNVAQRNKKKLVSNAC